MVHSVEIWDPHWIAFITVIAMVQRIVIAMHRLSVVSKMVLLTPVEKMRR